MQNPLSKNSAFPRSQLQALLCVLALLVCVLFTRPFVEMGVNDDWSFIRTAQVMAQTGHMAYNGWAAMILGWQVLLGALFIKIFGFSFTIVRVPIFLLGLLTTYLLHRVLVRFGLNAWNATLTTLTVALSPIFLPLVFTFMSDVSGIFCILLCVYACQRSLQAGTDAASLGWLYFAALTNILDGTVRQIVWLGVLVMVPSTAWLLRKRKGLLAHVAGLWLFGFICIELCMHWYAKQRYAVNEKLIDVPIDAASLTHLAGALSKGFVSLLLFSLPIVIVFPLRLLDLERRKMIKAFVAISLAMLVIMALGYLHFEKTRSLDPMLLPLLVNTVGTRGIMQFGEVIGQQPVVLHVPLRALITLVTVFSGLSCAAYLLLTRKNKTQIESAEQQPSLSWYQATILLLPFSFAYIALLMPRAASPEHTLFDRYLLPLIIALAVFLLRYLQQHSKRNESLLSVGTLLMLTLYTVAGTHDFFAMSRARLAAATEVTQSGIPRTALDGGFEYDAWTQITVAGYVNDPHITPASAYRRVPENSSTCQQFFEPWTPVVMPEYALAFDPLTCFKPSHYAAVPYQTWLPPRNRSIYIQRLH